MHTVRHLLTFRADGFIGSFQRIRASHRPRSRGEATHGSSRATQSGRGDGLGAEPLAGGVGSAVVGASGIGRLLASMVAPFTRPRSAIPEPEKPSIPSFAYVATFCGAQVPGISGRKLIETVQRLCGLALIYWEPRCPRNDGNTVVRWNVVVGGRCRRPDRRVGEVNRNQTEIEDQEAVGGTCICPAT